MNLPILKYEEPVFRPPSEGDSFILQVTIGCSWNHCTYCAMYRHKEYRVRPLELIQQEIELVAKSAAPRRIFLGDGDALAADTDYLIKVLELLQLHFPKLQRVSCYATARNLLEKSEEELASLRKLGLSLLYMGPESGDDIVLKRIAKGANFAEHVEAARRAHQAEIKLSLIFLLGAGGIERSQEHAEASADLCSAMNSRYASLLTLTVVPQAPLQRLVDRGKFELPTPKRLMQEMRIFVDRARPTNTVFRSNHASNYLPIEGRLPRDREQLIAIIDAAESGKIPLRPEFLRGL